MRIGSHPVIGVGGKGEGERWSEGPGTMSIREAKRSSHRSRTVRRLVEKSVGSHAGWGPRQVSSGGPGDTLGHWILNTLSGCFRYPARCGTPGMWNRKWALGPDRRGSEFWFYA